MTPRPALFDEAPTPELVESLLQDGYDVRLRLTGVSMRPLVSSGSVLRFTPISEDPAVVGDIVLARRDNGMLVAHRLVAWDESLAWTRGDSVGRPDPPLPRSRILGCAVRMESPFGLPLRNALARATGRLLSRTYPFAVRAYHALRARKDATR